jgi:hypothetical protein|tara:strand:+ start:310 stop:486 length:177 start_codon:yes stop_codon:yes gene_type:complete
MRYWRVAGIAKVEIKGALNSLLIASKEVKVILNISDCGAILQKVTQKSASCAKQDGYQ